MYGEYSTGVTVRTGQTTASLSFGPGARGRTWTVTQVSAAFPTAPSGAICTLSRNGAFVTYLIPTGDVAGAGSPIVLKDLETLTLSWTGLTAGMAGTVFVMYDDGK